MKRTIMMAALVLGAATILLGQTQNDSKREGFKIEEYSFTWNVIKVGDASVRIEKTNETTRVEITKNDDFVFVLPADAKKIGDALSATDREYAKMRGAKEDKRETVNAGDYQVTFWQSPKYGFSVDIAEKASIAFGRVSLDRKEANSLVPHLKRAVAMATYVDKLIDGALK